MSDPTPQLVLVRAAKSRTSGEWSDDDYDVREGDAKGRVDGRIMLTPQNAAREPWFWSITVRMPRGLQERGCAASREAAMAAFRTAWDRCRPTIPWR